MAYTLDDLQAAERELAAATVAREAAYDVWQRDGRYGAYRVTLDAERAAEKHLREVQVELDVVPAPRFTTADLEAAEREHAVAQAARANAYDVWMRDGKWEARAALDTVDAAASHLREVQMELA